MHERKRFYGNRVQQAAHFQFTAFVVVEWFSALSYIEHFAAGLATLSATCLFLQRLQLNVAKIYAKLIGSLGVQVDQMVCFVIL